MNSSKKILILGPHTDDGELGMGGTMHRLIEEGNEVHYATFCIADQSLPPEFPKGTLKREVADACRILGVNEKNLHMFDYEVRTFSYHRQELLDDIINLRNKIQPTMVFCPTPRDLHQDHIVISNEAIRAFKKVNILAYEMPWNNLNFETDAFYELSHKNVETKIKALQAYKSQTVKDYMQEDFIKGLAKVRGVQISVEFAEAFEVLRWINFLN